MASITVSKTVHAGSNPASPAHKEKTGIQIIAGVSVFFSKNLLFLMYVLVQKSTFGNSKFGVILGW